MHRVSPELLELEGESVRLWTYQNLCVLNIIEAEEVFKATWEKTPENFRSAYRWMLAQLNKSLATYHTTPPVWCWYTCGGKHEAPSPTTARDLYGDWSFIDSITLLEILVPVNQVLFSSYYVWNDLLDASLTGTYDGSKSAERQWMTMFQAPLLKHEDDEIQAVVPYLSIDWIKKAINPTQ